MLQADWKDRKDIESIKELHVQNKKGEMVPLGSMLSLRKILSPRVVNRYNQYPSATITAVQNPAVSTGEAMKAVEEIGNNLPKGFGYEWSGISFQEKNSQGQIGYLITLAVIFGYLFLVAQYESWITPLPVLTSVAVAMLGALVGLFITGLSLSIYAQLGLILLVGLAAKNAILIVEFAKQRQEKGEEIVSATAHASQNRLRPILMTSFAFILGVVPLAFSLTSGSELRQPLGTAVMYGMLGVTFMGLIFTPVFFYVIRKHYKPSIKE
jgi:multidrug efflux pump subunit AcrB